MKFNVETYGCTANQADSEKIVEMYRNRGHTYVEEVEDADAVIINTCTVTGRTERRMLRRISEMKKKFNHNLIVAGCLPAAQPELISSPKIIKPRDLIGYLSPRCRGVIGTVPISEGCVGNCSYCIVKKARGSLVSFSTERILESTDKLVRDGAKEIRMTSQDTGAYGLDLGLRLPDLIDKVTSIDGNFKIRIGMMNPFTAIDIIDDLLDSYDNAKVFKFLHIPIQSGSDDVLRDMNRNYSVSDWTHIVSKFKKRFPSITISTDFIVGYPTETEDDFEKSMEILRKMRAEKVNITRYSPRPNTEAIKLENLPDKEKKERSRKMSELCRKIALEKNKEWIGKTLDVLTTEVGKKGGVVARDESYKCIILDEVPIGSEHKIRIKDATSTYLIGERI